VLLICYEDLLGEAGSACEERVVEVKNLLAELMCEYHVVEDVEGTDSATPSLGSNDDFYLTLVHALQVEGQ
jgi:hypothetical protein